jgi:hypothetical protein
VLLLSIERFRYVVSGIEIRIEKNRAIGKVGEKCDIH